MILETCNPVLPFFLKAVITDETEIPLDPHCIDPSPCRSDARICGHRWAGGRQYASLWSAAADAGYTFCSSTLIAGDIVLTAGHCTSFWSADGINEVWVTFGPYASVDPYSWEISGGTWHLTHSWATHPGYFEEEWPSISDYGLVFLDTPVEGITPAALPEVYFTDEVIDAIGPNKATWPPEMEGRTRG